MTIFQTNIKDLVRIYLHEQNLYYLIEEIGDGKGIFSQYLKTLSQVKKGERKEFIDFNYSLFHEIDRAIDAISSLEIAAMSGFFGVAGNTKEESRMYKFLNNNFLKKYYETYERKYLPQIFRLRLESNQDVPTFSINETVQGRFFSFIETDVWYKQNIEQLHVFYNKFHLESAVHTTSNMQSFLESVSSSIEEQISCAETDLLRIFEFYSNLEECISGFSSNRILQSAVWHKHGAALRHGFRYELLMKALSNISFWRIPSDSGFEFESHLINSHAALLKLRKNSHEKPLNDLMEKLRLIPENELSDGFT